jgi:hypothetical protein
MVSVSMSSCIGDGFMALSHEPARAYLLDCAKWFVHSAYLPSGWVVQSAATIVNVECTVLFDI